MINLKLVSIFTFQFIYILYDLIFIVFYYIYIKLIKIIIFLNNNKFFKKA